MGKEFPNAWFSAQHRQEELVGGLRNEHRRNPTIPTKCIFVVEGKITGKRIW
jgi:hypothetical protein